MRQKRDMTSFNQFSHKIFSLVKYIVLKLNDRDNINFVMNTCIMQYM